jgi:NAD+ kinase
MHADSAPRRLGIVVHPSRPLDRALEAIREWTEATGTAFGQVRVDGQTREVAEPVEATDCDLLVALGGDGTTLAALHAGAKADRPVLGIACGSIGVLTATHADRVDWALEQLAAGRSTTTAVPALEVVWDDGERALAINDLVILRDGPGQSIVSIEVDGVLFNRVAGDGVVVATALGSSAYTMAAGGPLLASDSDGLVVTPLAPHGGSRPPLVTGGAAELTLTVEPSFSGVRYEVDGRRQRPEGDCTLTLRRKARYATLLTFADDEPRLTGLRHRGLLLDSPRVLVHGRRHDG